MWRALKQKLRNRKPHGGWTLLDLKKAMVDIWEKEISINLINNYIDMMPERGRVRGVGETHTRTPSVPE